MEVGSASRVKENFDILSKQKKDFLKIKIMNTNSSTTYSCSEAWDLINIKKINTYLPFKRLFNLKIDPKDRMYLHLICIIIKINKIIFAIQISF